MTDVRGSHFSPLGDVELQQTEVDEVMAVSDQEQGTGEPQAQTEVANDGPGLNLTVAEMEEEVFQFSASQESIKESLRPLRKPDENQVGEGRGGGKENSRVFKEVTNIVGSCQPS